MKEIGGYFQLENFHGEEYHPEAYRFNLARTAISWFFKEVHCNKIYMPYFICGSVTDRLIMDGFTLSYYHINEDFTVYTNELPQTLAEDEWLFVNNAYGQLSDEYIQMIQNKYQNVLFDYTHAFFRKPLPGTNVVYSIRKYFGITDGAYLVTDMAIQMPEKQDQSWNRFNYILGRYEESASVHYQEMLDTAHGYVNAVPMQMSPVTLNILHGIDYAYAKKQREMNFSYHADTLNRLNGLKDILHQPSGSFVYPMLVNDGPAIRKQLASQKIFVPTYWSEVFQNMPEDTIEHKYAKNILAIPCDQRYTEKDMQIIIDALLQVL
ncbi:MAG: hypothetical protein IKR11_02130 [Solobacterium sp.]|nr:hypothetical protein [Solobacterium sp.]